MPSIAQCLHEAGLDASEIAELLPGWVIQQMRSRVTLSLK